MALVLVATLVLAAAPLPSLEPGFGVAWAKGGGGQGGGNGGGHGGGRGGGDTVGGGPGHGAGTSGVRGRGGDAEAPGRGGQRGRAAAPERAPTGLFPGIDRGAARRDARERYATAAGWSAGARAPGAFGRPAQGLDDDLTARLVARGWQRPAAEADADGFRNHGQRVSSMVEIAKALGYGAHVGALQATFGGPYGADAASDDGTADGGAAWDGDWRTASLDITGDGVVDQRDLEAARSLGQVPSSAAVAPPAAAETAPDAGGPAPEPGA